MNELNNTLELDYYEALQQTVETNRPVVVPFTSEWVISNGSTIYQYHCNQRTGTVWATDLMTNETTKHDCFYDFRTYAKLA